jgi:hypothetical protein
VSAEVVTAAETSTELIPALSNELPEITQALESVTGPAEPPPTGLTQPIDPTKHPQAISTYTSLVEETHPERATPLVQPDPFDQAAYEKDPSEYLSVSEPGRVWQSAQPGEGVTPISAFGPTRHVITSGESVALMVRVNPNMPVSFTSFDLGTFGENGLPNITVAADEQGYARAIWEATPGVIANARILCASPTTSGQVLFVVTVKSAP